MMANDRGFYTACGSYDNAGRFFLVEKQRQFFPKGKT
jgi:hypothetical protein